MLQIAEASGVVTPSDPTLPDTSSFWTSPYTLYSTSKESLVTSARMSERESPSLQVLLRAWAERVNSHLAPRLLAETSGCSNSQTEYAEEGIQKGACPRLCIL